MDIVFRVSFSVIHCYSFMKYSSFGDLFLLYNKKSYYLRVDLFTKLFFFFFYSSLYMIK